MGYVCVCVCVNVYIYNVISLNIRLKSLLHFSKYITADTPIASEIVKLRKFMRKWMLITHYLNYIHIYIYIYLTLHPIRFSP